MKSPIKFVNNFEQCMSEYRAGVITDHCYHDSQVVHKLKLKIRRRSMHHSCPVTNYERAPPRVHNNNELLDPPHVLREDKPVAMVMATKL